MPTRSIGVASLAVMLSVAGLGAADGGLQVVEAVKHGNRQALGTLLKQRVDVNAPEADGMTALHWAVRGNDLETTQLLIRAGANVKAANRYGLTPLSLAATNGNAGVIEMLIKAGADPNVALADGETILMTAARTGDAAAVKMLLTHGANVNAKEKSEGQTALIWAATEGHTAAVQALIEGGADVNVRTVELKYPPYKWGVVGMVSTNLPRGAWTPLMYAARQNAMGVARTLVGAGANMNLTDPEGATALITSIINAHYDLAAMLLEKGADPNIADQTGMAALYATVDMHTMRPMIMRPTPKPSGELDAPALVKRLLAHGANPNATLKRPPFGRHHDLGGDASMGEGTTPFMRAAKAGDIAVMRILLEGGADPALRRKDFATALTLAASARTSFDAPATTGPSTVPGASTIEAIKLCVQLGLDVNAFNASGQTALHIAAARGDDEVVELLAENGAMLDLQDKQRRTPVDVALGVGGKGRGSEIVPVHEKTAALLRRLMSDKATGSTSLR